MSTSPALTPLEFFNHGDRYFIPQLSIDVVIFGFHEGELKVLLLQWKESSEWCLPGGFIFQEEAVDDAANRIVKERTGLPDIYLKQFHAFGHPSRQRGKHGFTVPKGAKKDSWLLRRFVTIGYLALVEYSRVAPVPDTFSSVCRWERVSRVPKLMLDHNHIVDKALQSLRMNLNDYPVGRDLLPEKFTMPQLQQLYETVLGKKMDRRNFQKKMLALGILEKLKERKRGVAHKAPYLYRFDTRKYLKSLDQGLKFGF